MSYMANVLQEAETAYSSGAPEFTPSFLVGSMLFICFLVFSVVFLSFWSCPRCSPEFFSTFIFSLFLEYPRGIDTFYRTSKASKSYKWEEIVSHIYKQDNLAMACRLCFTSNFSQLLDRLELCTASYTEGNNGVRNVIVEILDSMKIA